MSFRCICSTLFISLVLTLIVTLILGLTGTTTITVTSPIILAVLLFSVGLITALVAFYALLFRKNNQCYSKCLVTKLFLLYIFSVALIIFVLVGFITFLSGTTVNLVIFAIALFLLVGILFTEISIVLPLLTVSNQE